MSPTEAVKIFIGSGEASLLERKTLIYSLKKHCSRELDIYVFNGTHDSIEHNDDEPVLANMPLWIKYQNFTEFSNYRFLIPELCGHKGRAIFLDSDMVCIGDIAKFFDQPMDGNALLAKPEAYKGESCWGLSQILFDCSQCHFDLETIFREIQSGQFSNLDLHQMKPPFLAVHPLKIGGYGSTWNVFDQCHADTDLIHYTNLGTQPWKFAGHPFEKIWFRYFNEAREAGVITNQDLKKTLSRAYARQDILKPSSTGPASPKVSSGSKNTLKKIEREIKRLWRGSSRKAA